MLLQPPNEYQSNDQLRGDVSIHSMSPRPIHLTRFIIEGFAADSRGDRLAKCYYLMKEYHPGHFVVWGT